MLVRLVGVKLGLFDLLFVMIHSIRQGRGGRVYCIIYRTIMKIIGTQVAHILWVFVSCHTKTGLRIFVTAAPKKARLVPPHPHLFLVRHKLYTVIVLC